MPPGGFSGPTISGGGGGGGGTRPQEMLSILGVLGCILQVWLVYQGTSKVKRGTGRGRPGCRAAKAQAVGGPGVEQPRHRPWEARV